jgi:hypothetical protein
MLIADVALGVGVVALGVATVVTLLRWSSAPTTAKQDLVRSSVDW